VFVTPNRELHNDCSAATTPISDLESTLPPSIQLEADDLDPISLIIDQFPFGNPGAPVPGPYQESCDTGCDALGDSIQAPFLSKHDWDIACWVKDA
jgi:hypothetical protein